MTPKNIRITIRWLHIVLGLVIMCYIYSPFHEHIVFQRFVKFIVVPVIVFSGLWIWKFRAFNKFFGIK